MSATVKAHGLDGKLVEPDWVPLTVDEVRALLRQFPACGEPIEILSASPRPFSAASLVATRDGRVFVKRHHRTVRDAEGLREEHRFMAHLLAHGAKVARVLVAASGETAIEMGEWTYEVHDVPVGVDLYEDALSWTPFRSVGHAYSAGKALARTHLAAEGFDEPRRKARPLVAGFTIFAAHDPAAELERYLDARPPLAEDARVRERCVRALEVLAPFHAELEPLLGAMRPLWTHNDLHASNLFWSGTGNDAEATAVIDFGLADRTNPVHDLAHAIERNIVEWLVLGHGAGGRSQGSEAGVSVPIHFDHLSALLEGYEQVRPLSDEEASALAPMTALCHAEFALSETGYFLGVLHSEEKAPLASEDWLVGHARWFRGTDGKRLLNAIEGWAGTRCQRSAGAHRT